MKRHLAITGFALVALPFLAEGQIEARGETAASSRTEAGPLRAGAGGEAALEAAVTAGLPEAPVHRAIVEAGARSASAAEVDQAAVDAVARMRLAREAITRKDQRAPRPSEAEIVAGAEAVARGSGRADLETIRDAAPEGRNLTVSLRALSELQGRGIANTHAASAIAARLEAGASDRALTTFAAQVRSVADLGLSHHTAAGAGALEAAGTLGGSAGALGTAGALGATAGIGTGVGIGSAAGMGAGLAGSVGAGIIR